MKKIIIFIIIAVFFCLVPKPNVYAGMQPLTPQNVKKVVTTSATNAEFCKLITGENDVSEFSKNLLVGLGSPGQDPYITNLDKMECTNDTKEIIYGTLAITRNIPTEDVVYEQVFVIDDHYLRPTNIYNEFYISNPIPPEQSDTDKSIRGIFKGVSVTKGSLKHISDVEKDNYGDENYNEGDREFGYLVHVNTEGAIDNIYVLYQGEIYEYQKSLKDIKDVLLVDYTSNTTPTPDPASNAANATANWKTHTGDGFMVKYPPEWFANNCGNSLSTNLNPTNQSCATEGNAFAINIIPIVTTDYAFSEFKASGDIKKLKQISIDGQNSYQAELVSTPFEYLSTRIKVKNGAYDFILNNYDQREIYDQILSTFTFSPLSASKFSDSQTVDITNWKLYSNESFGFELKHPSDWKLTDNSIDTTNYKTATINVESPPRYDLSGYEEVGYHYLLQINFDGDKPIIGNYKGFIKNYEDGDQAITPVILDDLTLKESQEYKITQEILRSSKKTAN